MLFNGCFSLHQYLLRTRMDEYWHVLTLQNIPGGPKRLSFHFEQVPLRSMFTCSLLWLPVVSAARYDDKYRYHDIFIA